jgi:hypothetical protein
VLFEPNILKSVRLALQEIAMPAAPSLLMASDSDLPVVDAIKARPPRKKAINIQAASNFFGPDMYPV